LNLFAKKMNNLQEKKDKKTADAFASSWNNLPYGSVYTWDQFVDWLAPIKEKDIKGKNVLELGCGNASLMAHILNWQPAKIIGIDLGDSILSAKQNLEMSKYKNWEIKQADLVEYKSEGYDFVYSIGVLHHLKSPKKGFDSVIRNTKSKGSFHCWVYAREGNNMIVFFVDPIRKFASKLPWWVTKYFLATPLVFPYYLYAKFLRLFKKLSFLKFLPLYDYSLWIAKRNFLFFRHVAFDQLVTPQTTYIPRKTIEEWLKSNKNINQNSTYIVMRNGNSWKFGGKVK